jgi:hypothetical protein
MEEIGNLLPGVLKGYYSRKPDLLAQVLVPFWHRIAGHAIAENSRPIAFRNGTLTILASTDCWALQLRGLSAELRERINSFLGLPVVARVSARYKSGFEAAARPEVDVAPPGRNSELSQKARAMLDSQTDAAALDPAIRKALEESFVKYFSRSSKGSC